MVSCGPLVSVVISTWNRKETLKKAILSIKNQTYKNLEIVVVDNCSNDGTYEMIREKFSDILLIEMPSSKYGLCETIDIGLLSSHGEIVLVLDDDAYLENSETIEKVIQLFNERPNVGIITLRIKNPNGKEETYEWKKFAITEDKDLYYGNLLHGACFFIRRQLIDKGCLYDPDYFIYANEGDLAFKVLICGYIIALSKNLVAIHNKSGGKTTSRKVYFYVRNNLYTVWKYLPTKLAVLLTFRILVLSGVFVVLSKDLKNIKAYFRAIISFLVNLNNIKKKRQIVDDKILAVNKPIYETYFPSIIKLARRYIREKVR